MKILLLVFALLLLGGTAAPARADTVPGATPVLDDFNRPDENPLSGGGNWTALSSGGGQLLNNAVASAGTGTSTSGWNVSYTGDIEARATVLLSSNNAGVVAHATLNASGQLSGYIWQWQGANSPATFALYREDADTFTTLATFTGFSLAAGDQLALRVIGSSVQGWVYHDGSWQQVASATDTTYRTGQIGIRPRGLAPIIDDFGGGPVQAPPPPVQTIVSLTFDDAWSDQYVAGPMLAARGMHGTFYANSGTVGTSPSFLGWSQLQELAAAGNEIGGHTINHVDLTTTSAEEAQRQICQDRRALMSQGFEVTDFAYPYGARNSSLYPILGSCGYNSARRSWGLCSPAQDFCPVAETIPPANIWETRTQSSVRSWTTLQDLQNAVTQAETSGGGWITFVFHHVCDGCDSYATSQSTLAAFLDWLQGRSAGGTVVKTVHEVIGGPSQPAPSVADQTAPSSSISCGSSSCSSGWYNAPVSVSLSSADAETGVAVTRYTTDGSDPTAFSPSYTGSFTLSATTTVKYRTWDNAGNIESTRSQLIRIDAAPPSTSVTCNGDVCATTAYSAPVTVALPATDVGSGVAEIRYTTDGSDPSPSSSLYSAPFTVETTTTVKYAAADNAGNVESTKSQLIQIEAADTTPPTSSIACNGGQCSSGLYQASVSVTLSAVDGASGVAAIHYTTDGGDPSPSSPVYSGPFTLSATATVKYRAWDNAGNVEPVKAQLVQIDAVAPEVTLTNPVNGATVSGVVRVEATATDGGSGVLRVDFYVDGKLEGSSTAAPYRISWNTRGKKVAKGPHTIHAVAVDRAGNSRATASITVTVA